MIPNAFHQNFYLKNTLSLRIIRKNDVHSNGTNIFSLFAQNAKYTVAGNWIFGTRGIRHTDKQACQPDSLSTGVPQSFSNEKISDVQAVFWFVQGVSQMPTIYNNVRKGVMVQVLDHDERKGR